MKSSLSFMQLRKCVIWRVGLAVFILLGLVACAVSPPAKTVTVPLTPTGPEEAEEYAVYSAVIEALYLHDKIELIVVDDQTGLGYMAETGVDDKLEYARQKMPGLTPEIAADFKAQNQETYAVKSLFTLPCSYVLVSQAELQAIFQSRNGWDEFYRRYPHAQGRLTLSKVGFSSQRDKALVYAGNRSDTLAGMGFLILLVEEDGDWIIKDTVMVWVS
jgi:hypothetical protein